MQILNGKDGGKTFETAQTKKTKQQLTHNKGNSELVYMSCLQFYVTNKDSE